MFTFNTGLAELLYAIGVVGRFVDGGGLAVCVCIGLLHQAQNRRNSGEVHLLGSLLPKVNSVYKLRGLNHSCIAGVP